MVVVRIAAVALLTALLIMLPDAATAQGTAAVSGTITYTARSLLPANAIVTVQIAEISSAYPVPRVITEQKFSTNGAQVPFRFSVPYDPARINPNSRYTLQGNITSGNTVLFTTAATIPVITQGNPIANVTMLMYPASSGDLPNSSSGTGLLALAGLLIIGFGLVRLVRMRVIKAE
ncbi:MAG: hypothetical protein HC822_23320 [Oscillochloris sp.]|nr:hypothetical protein [Oscillochloris sp.]